MWMSNNMIKHSQEKLCFITIKILVPPKYSIQIEQRR